MSAPSVFHGPGGLLAGSSGADPPPPPRPTGRTEPTDAPPIFPEQDINVDELINNYDSRRDTVLLSPTDPFGSW